MLGFIRRVSFIGAAAVALVVAGCATPGASSPPTSAPQTPAGPVAYTVEVHQDPSLGAFLTGGGGKSLYILTKDPVGSSSCTGTCASSWPPFVLGSGDTVTPGNGVTGTLGTIKRPDGSDQVAINCQPLYYFSGDDGPAQTTGQGVNDVWFLAAPGGGGIGAGAAASPAASPAASSASTEDPTYKY